MDGVMPPDGAALQRRGRTIAKALRAVWLRTGRPMSMSDRPGRFLIQKTVYLLKSQGYPPATRYEYNVYLNGPYSPDLAAEYYAVGDDGLRSAPAATDIPPSTLNLVAEALSRSPDFLEGLTTVIDGVVTQGSPQAALSWAKSIKPQLSESTWREVRTFLSGHQELIAHR